MAALAAFTSVSFAQTYGVKAGLNLSNMLLKSDYGTTDSKIKPGFLIGGIADIPVMDQISVETGLFLSTKGCRYNDSTKYNLLYISIPVTTKYTYDLNGLKIFANAGPTIDFGLSGKIKYNTDGVDDVCRC